MARSLQFESLAQIGEEAQRLLDAGYEANGNWDLAQTCMHLTDWMRFPMDGYPRAFFPIRMMLWMMKMTIGRSQLKKILASGFQAGTPTMPATVHDKNKQSDEQAVADLKATIDRFNCHNGGFFASPLFGEMTKTEHTQLQLVHGAHHLAFLAPK